ncbi:hypothetical protein CRI77_01900 [Mycolicibacterium duvalii]|uniref:Uncharacterized protein n=1 Tax=Mycolicibacterium duvalii TaxID=39688 RepID=A0A7I7K5N8_9MYCO|nr:DUF2505 domain-containing protein [Mycolicibacterium duvalii]MCV7367521.1 DUF2505 domain-containing protein [Mycolicibacterium duvalii]PEG44153.1 hypothetical protein CRI77_01900 [Mycolicibacterium duvalii]BBX18888.1 hypothetical protein MDUV_37480 [Mycolicibacterium duvalii]
MPRSFDLAAEYEGTVEQVHRAFSDEQYWLVRLEDSGADHVRLDEMTIEDSGAIRVRTTQILRADRLPAVVTQFHRGDLSFVREEMWTPVVDGQASAVVSGSIPGAPASLTGNALLLPAPEGVRARLDLTAVVEVRVPLVGGKIENFIGNQLVDLLIAEQRFTTGWITENS